MIPHSRVFPCIALLVLVMPSASKALPDVPAHRDGMTNVDAIRHEILQARERLGRGRFMVNASCPVAVTRFSSYEGVVRRYTILQIRDKGFARHVLDCQHPQSRWTAKTLVRGDNVFFDGGISLPHANTGTSTGPYHLTRFVFDPTVLGLRCSPTLAMQSATLTGALGPLSHAPKVSVDVRDDRTLIIVTCSYPRGDVIYHVRPAEGYAVTRVEKRPRGGARVEVVESEYRTVSTDDGTPSVWYPHRVSYRDVVNGTTTFQEDLEVTFVPDRDLPESEFTLAAMELTQGRKVVDETLKVSVWDDGRLRRVTGRDVYDANKRAYVTVGKDRNMLDPAAAQDRANGRWTALLAANVGGSALLLLFLAAKRLSRNGRAGRE